MVMVSRGTAVGEALAPFKGQVVIATKRPDENLGALCLDLSDDDLRDIEAAAARVTVVGERHPESLARMAGR